jgi:hypothetical protein
MDGVGGIEADRAFEEMRRWTRREGPVIDDDPQGEIFD